MILSERLETIFCDKNNFSVKEFLGIPYAEAPVGQMRLKLPIPKSPFSTPFHAFNFGPGCLQHPNFVAKAIPLSEDYLFLIMFVPESISNISSRTSNNITSGTYVNTSDSMLPAMIFIHGGGFVAGVSTYFSRDILAT